MKYVAYRRADLTSLLILISVCKGFAENSSEIKNDKQLIKKTRSLNSWGYQYNDNFQSIKQQEKPLSDFSFET